jgi:formamidopyrimidine-DNA glycosylase
MPELPEVETVVRALRPVLEGQPLARVVARRGDLRWPLPDGFGQRLTGARVLSISRRAKYGLVATDRGETLIFHLGMSGRLRLDAQGDGPHDHVLIETGAGRRVVLTDPRRFGMMDLWPSDRLGEHRLLAALGAEPLDADLAPLLARAFAGRVAPVKALLLDQRIVAGVGNIYACEALWRARIRPDRPAGTLSRAEVARLARAVPMVLEAAIAAGGSSLRDHVQPDGTMGMFQHGWAVYGREGADCPRGHEVERLVQSGRSSFFCPRCQR